MQHSVRSPEATHQLQLRGSYFEAWLRRQGLTAPAGAPAHDKGVAERGVYLSFLEAQLEKTAAAALEAHDLRDRLATQERLLTEVVARLNGVSAAVVSAQAYSERQGEEWRRHQW